MRAVVFALVFALAPSSAAAAVAKGPWVQRVTPTTAVVKVEVDPPQAVAVEMGDGTRVESAEVRSLHAVPLAGLTPGTRYTVTVASHAASFVTAPAANAAFKFLAYGDNRTDDAGHASVVRAMAPFASDFLVHTGDFVEDGGSAKQWQRFFDTEAPLLSTRCLFSAVGNHELTDGAGTNYARYFGPNEPDARTKLEELNGTFRWGNTRLFLVNGMVSFGKAADRVWLEHALTEADTEAGLVWRVLVVHHGPWSSGPHGNNTRLHDGAVPAILKNHKVDLVLAGHDHLYDRGWSDGLAYVVTGGGGAPTYKVKHRVPESRKVESTHHFVEMAVDDTAMKLTAIRADGSILERCNLLKTGWDCDSPSTPPPPPPPASHCGCTMAPVGWGGGLPFAAGIAIAWRRRRRVY